MIKITDYTVNECRFMVRRFITLQIYNPTIRNSVILIESA